MVEGGRGEGKDPTWKEGHCPGFDLACLLLFCIRGLSPRVTFPSVLSRFVPCRREEQTAPGDPAGSLPSYSRTTSLQPFSYVSTAHGEGKCGWEGMRIGCRFPKNSKADLTRDIARGWGTGRFAHKHRLSRFAGTGIISHRPSGALQQPICSGEVYVVSETADKAATRRGPAGRRAGITAPKVPSGVKTGPGK